MNRSVALTLALAVGILLSLGTTAQSKKKGPAYKNASISEKYQGTSQVIVRTDPTELQGPKAKNHKPSDNDYSGVVYTASLSDSNYTADKKFKVIDLKSSKTKYDKGLKGPRFKNYKPGK